MFHVNCSISNTGLEQSLAQSREEIEMLQEKISSLSVQLLDKEEKIKQLIEENQQLIEQMRGTHTDSSRRVTVQYLIYQR